MRNLRVLFVGLLILLPLTAARAQGGNGNAMSLLGTWIVEVNPRTPDLPAAGSQFQVNTYTAGEQFLPHVSADASGNFVVVWTSDDSGGTDSDYFSVQGQRFDATGTPVGDEFQVNSYTTEGQGTPAVAAGADGDFVVVWTSYGSGGTDSDYSIQGQRFDSAGARLGGEFQVNTYTTGYQFSPAVAVQADGDFVVVWTSSGSAGTDSDYDSIQGQRFDSAGAAVGNEFQVNTYTTGWQSAPALAADADGDFVVVWTSDGSGGTDSDRSVQGQRFDAAGSPVGSEFQVSSNTTGYAANPSIALSADGSFLAAWRSATFPSGRVLGRRLDGVGVPLGDEFQISTYPSAWGKSSQSVAAVGVDFIVVWDSFGSNGSDSSSSSVQGQRLASCLANGDCDDGLYCNGLETCRDSRVCQAGSDPCEDGVSCTEDSCDEVADACDNAPDDSLCDNGLFCDGAEICNPVQGCQSGSDPCPWPPWESCGESDDMCHLYFFADGFEPGNTAAWSKIVP